MSPYGLSSQHLSACHLRTRSSITAPARTGASWTPRLRLGPFGQNGYSLPVDFEWDPQKAAANLRKHGVSFAEATTVFGDRLGISAPDPDHSYDEDRYILVGRSSHGRLLIVAHTDRDDRIRIISARELTRSERKDYEETLGR
jgi:uncharacterized DUF497 family protein